MKKIDIKLDNQVITVKKLPLGKYAELLKQLKELPKKISGLDGLKNEEIFENLPAIVSESLPEFIGLIEIATDLKKEDIEAMGLDEVVKICIAVYEVNNYREIYEQIKKVTGRQPANLPGPGKISTTG